MDVFNFLNNYDLSLLKKEHLQVDDVPEIERIYSSLSTSLVTFNHRVAYFFRKHGYNVEPNKYNSKWTISVGKLCKGDKSQWMSV